MALIVSRERRRTPIIYVFFLLGYLAMSVLVVDQRHTIDLQRALIHTLYEDSHMLATLQNQRIQQHQQAQRDAAVPK